MCLLAYCTEGASPQMQSYDREMESVELNFMLSQFNNP
jgi:hypothetical protein